MPNILTYPCATGDAARNLSGTELADALRDSRRRTLAAVLDLSDSQWTPRRRQGINPIAWELGHVAWFAEFWTLRGPHAPSAGGISNASGRQRIVGRDAIFDSARLSHADRWGAELPPRNELLSLLDRQLDATLRAIPEDDPSDEALYFHRLSLFHEDMHGEAFAWMRDALGYPRPTGLAPVEQPANEALRFAEGDSVLGPSTGRPGFLFDNEVRTETIRIRPFEIDASCVTAGQFSEFVAAGGYHRAEFWQPEGAAWQAASALSHPSRWRRAGSEWEVRSFDGWEPLNPLRPVMHVNAFEAEAYCRWKGGRLPSAAEWECAAANSPRSRFHWGSGVWEWTSDVFAPYAGFVPGPYKDYSLPWFGTCRELRGGAFATHPRLLNPHYRNFFEPQRADIFAGFRTARTL
ncbi:MAG: SUMF1/EgtB/PvdO family nonheme iron enzyme [Pseudomonadota bacterium]|nr:SUMF1/EgtB/PvdO family nonheme iron enzyme [Pseudomonadota bacterium]